MCDRPFPGCSSRACNRGFDHRRKEPKTWHRKSSLSSSRDPRVNKAAPSRGASLSEATRSAPSRATRTQTRRSCSRTPGATLVAASLEDTAAIMKALEGATSFLRNDDAVRNHGHRDTARYCRRRRGQGSRRASCLYFRRLRSGRCRGRPRAPRRGGIASTSTRASCESFRFAPVRRTASGTPRPLADQVTLTAALGSIRGIRTGVPRPGCTARMEQLSTIARDQSIWSQRASQSSSPMWIRSHTLARCQSRRRLQHVIPDPHPSSWGSICQGMPLRRTKTMPVRHPRSETRGRPPCGRRVESARMARQDSITDLEAARRP